MEYKNKQWNVIKLNIRFLEVFEVIIMGMFYYLCTLDWTSLGFLNLEDLKAFTFSSYKGFLRVCQAFQYVISLWGVFIFIFFLISILRVLCNILLKYIRYVIKSSRLLCEKLERSFLLPNVWSMKSSGLWMERLGNTRKVDLVKDLFKEAVFCGGETAWGCKQWN